MSGFNKGELITALRFSIATEYEAVQLYTQIADSIDDKKVEKVLRDIAEEELVHVGEFLRLLIYLRPKEFDSYLEGIKETEKVIKNASYYIKNGILCCKISNGAEIPIEALYNSAKKSSIAGLLKNLVQGIKK